MKPKFISYLLLASAILVISCTSIKLAKLSCLGKGASEIAKPDSPDINTIQTIITEPELIFGFLGESKYSYCPSVLKQEDESIHIYFCGNPEDMVMVDHIFHVKINPDGSKTSPKSVLQPGVSGAWDDHHTCDPTVVEGSFIWGNTTYKYAMFFLGNNFEVYYNEIGVAFSNTLDADSWIKYPKQIVQKTWNTKGDQLNGALGKSWGVGQPSVVSLDGEGRLLLTYTIGDVDGTRIVWSEANFSSMENYSISTPQTIVQKGLMAIDNKSQDFTCNSEFAINKETDKIVMIRPVHPHPTDYPTYLNTTLEIDYMNLSDFMNQKGKWTSIIRVTPNETGYPRNHNATLLKDNFGHLRDWDTPTFYYTVSKSAPSVEPSGDKHAEWTYHIWKSQVQLLKK